MSYLEDDENYRGYFWLAKEQFYEVLSFVDEDIQKMGTNYWKAVTTNEQLAACLFVTVTIQPTIAE